MESKIVVDAEGKRNVMRQPLVNSLMFFRGTADDVAVVRHELNAKAMIYHTPGKPREASPISDSEMEIFRLVTDNMDVPLKYLGADTEKYTVGERVRVIAGPLEGAVGHVCRIRGDRRLVVSIAGVCAVATTYIPANLLSKL